LLLRYPGEFDRDSAEAMLASGRCDLIAFGRRFIANPDLPERIRLGAEENGWDEDTLYGPSPEGFIDYPTLADGAPNEPR
jgi:N-ethylmaleimide reductase